MVDALRGTALIGFAILFPLSLWAKGLPLQGMIRYQVTC